MEYKIVGSHDLVSVAEELIHSAATTRDPFTVMAVSVIGGERAHCCDEAIVVYDGEVPVGMATVAHKGESGAGVPEIVGVFVSATHRCSGVGRELFVRAIVRCRERNLVPLRATILSRGMSALVKKLPPEVLVDVTIVDQSRFSPF
jgi:GNAT superfamily N-acetyltransferase